MTNVSVKGTSVRVTGHRFDPSRASGFGSKDQLRYASKVTQLVQRIKTFRVYPSGENPAGYKDPKTYPSKENPAGYKDPKIYLSMANSIGLKTRTSFIRHMRM